MADPLSPTLYSYPLLPRTPQVKAAHFTAAALRGRGGHRARRARMRAVRFGAAAAPVPRELMVCAADERGVPFTSSPGRALAEGLGCWHCWRDGPAVHRATRASPRSWPTRVAAWACVAVAARRASRVACGPRRMGAGARERSAAARWRTRTRSARRSRAARWRARCALRARSARRPEVQYLSAHHRAEAQYLFHAKISKNLPFFSLFRGFLLAPPQVPKKSPPFCW